MTEETRKKIQKNDISNKFRCKAEESGYCNQWLRQCVSWENCNFKSYGAPCPGCVASSPLKHEQCNGCKYQKWKKDNYCD